MTVQRFGGQGAFFVCADPLVVVSSSLDYTFRAGCGKFFEFHTDMLLLWLLINKSFGLIVCFGK